MVVPGHELWHPNPGFYSGPEPLWDMRPYYVFALVTLLGPATSVLGTASRTRPTRVITSGPRTGEVIPVSININIHVTGILTHASGVLSTLAMSFDAVATKSANIEIHGETGSPAVPDPNHFAGEVQLRRLHRDAWENLPMSAGYRDVGRGYGVADLALTPPGEEPRAGGALGYHVLDVWNPSSLLPSTTEERAWRAQESDLPPVRLQPLDHEPPLHGLLRSAAEPPGRDLAEPVAWQRGRRHVGVSESGGRPSIPCTR